MMSDVDGTSIERELDSGERLLWKGHPRGGIRFHSFDFFVIPFSLIWSGLAFFAGFAALMSVERGATDWPSLIPVIPFVLIGIYILVGRFFVDAMMRAKTEYGLTNRRAIIVSGLFSRNIKSIDLLSTPEILLSEKGDRSGTITFGATPFGGWMQRNPWSFGSSSATPAFEMIEDVRSVYRIINEMRAAKRQPERY
jgi:hypothetical protein